MYIPNDFKVEDLPVLVEFMRRYSFATLVTHGGHGLTASHVPVVVSDDEGSLPTLFAHIARANLQWRDFDSGTPALLIFQGPHGYVSPSLYSVHPSVPTWNYTAVHAYGTPVIVEGEDVAREHVYSLVAQYESHRQKPWRPDLPADYVARMLKQIVPFRVQVTDLEGKFKLSQNREQSDRDNVATAFEATPDETLQTLGRFMRSTPALPD